MQGSWKLSLRTVFKNFRRDHPTDNTGHRQKSTASAEPPSKRQRISDGGAQEITDEEYDDAIDKLKAECKKNKGKNHATIKELMQVTEQRRRKWIEEESPLVVEILSKYPSLTSTRPPGQYCINSFWSMKKLWRWTYRQVSTMHTIQMLVYMYIQQLPCLVTQTAVTHCKN